MGKDKTLPYLSRNVSHLSFNLRVSDEAQKDIPMAEKVMFQGISFSNFGEFMTVRYPIACETEPEENLIELTKAISKHYIELCERFNKFNKKHQVIKKVKDLGDKGQKWAEEYFVKNVYPGLQTITFDRTRNLNLHSGLYVLVTYEVDDEPTAGYIEIPKGISRFIQVPGKNCVIAVEDLISKNIKKLFLKASNCRVTPFSIARSAEVYCQVDKYTDPLTLIQNTLREREKSWITYLEVGSDRKDVLKLLRKVLPMDQNTIVFMNGLINLQDLKKMPSGIYPEGQTARKCPPIDTFPTSHLFDYIKKQDRLAFHPYESYQGSMVRWLQEAADDPDVVSIKISLYRVSDNSEIIDALLRAADKGKLVTVLVELKARFDEHHNIEISNALREGGVRIVYTKPDIKTHAKVCLITRKEKKGLRIYSQIGTGNYSESNAKQYTDYSYFTADSDIGNELTQFFNLITSDQGTFKAKHIIYAPYNMRDELVEHIDKQIKLAKKGKDAKIVAKCNALTDDKIADKLTEAAKAGVKITLIIRSACIIQPQKNIKIYSIVGQFLEHSRVYAFGKGKDTEVFIGSADLMVRNLSRRNELLIKVEQTDIRERILKHLEWYLKDNTNRREILPNYGYKAVERKKDEKKFSVQERCYRESKGLAV